MRFPWGEQQLVPGAAELSSDSGKLIFATKAGDTLKSFPAAAIAYTTTESDAPSLNVWI